MAPSDANGTDPNQTPASLESRSARANVKRQKSASRKRVWLIVAALVLVVLAGVGIGVYAYANWVKQKAVVAIQPDNQTRSEVAKVLQQPKVEAPYEYIVLLGDDRRPGQTRARTDTIILVGIEKATGNINMLSIPRDTRTEVPGHGITKINHAGAYGGPALSIETISKFSGVPISHYVRIDFDGLDKLIDIMGGVDVSDGYGPVKHLDGRLAVSFMRQRHKYASGDFKRMDNQQRVLLVLAKKVRSASFVAQIPAIVDSLAGHLDTDMSIDYMQSLVDKSRGRPIRNYVLTGKTGMIGGVSYVLIDPAEKKRVFDAFLAGELPVKKP